MALRPQSVALVAIFLLANSACNYGLYNAEQMEATVQSLARTQMAEMLTALPTNTSPPTATATHTDTPQPTVTPSPSEAASETASLVPVQTQVVLMTVTPLGYTDPTQFTEDKNNKADYNAPLVLDNRSGEEIHLIILSPQYGDYLFTKNMTLILPEATYTYRAWIGNKGPFSGSFSITNGDKHLLIFREDNINFSTP